MAAVSPYFKRSMVRINITYTIEQTFINYLRSFLLFINARAIDARLISFRAIVARIVRTPQVRLAKRCLFLCCVRCVGRKPILKLMMTSMPTAC